VEDLLDHTPSHAEQEWRTQLRSSLHPGLFAVAYRVAAQLADLCGWSLPAKAELLLSTPKIVQAVFAALLDCYTWKLAEKVYGRGSRTAIIAVGHHPVNCVP
jgi:phosphatidylinositol glycan class B